MYSSPYDMMIEVLERTKIYYHIASSRGRGCLPKWELSSLTREQLPYLLKNPCEVPAQLSRFKDPYIGQGLLIAVVIHLQLYLEVADVGTGGGTDELPGFQIRKILSLIYVLFLG